MSNLLTSSAVVNRPPRRIPWGTDFRDIQVFQGIDTIHLSLYSVFQNHDFLFHIKYFKHLAQQTDQPIFF